MDVHIEKLKRNATSYIEIGEGFKDLKGLLILESFFWWLILPLIPLYRKIAQIRQSILKITSDFKNYSLMSFSKALRNLIFAFIIPPIGVAILCYGYLFPQVLQDSFFGFFGLWYVRLFIYYHISTFAQTLFISNQIELSAKMFELHCEDVYRLTKSYFLKEVQHDFKNIATASFIFFFINLIPFAFLITYLYIGGKMGSAGDKLIHVFKYELDNIEQAHSKSVFTNQTNSYNSSNISSGVNNQGSSSLQLAINDLLEDIGDHVDKNDLVGLNQDQQYSYLLGIKKALKKSSASTGNNPTFKGNSSSSSNQTYVSRDTDGGWNE